MKKLFSLVILGAALLGITKYAFVERDWEYWSRYSFEAPITKEISYLIKLEQAINFKIGKYFEL